MNLTELADVAEHVSHNELNKKTSDAMGHIAALLRAAACEQVGTEWAADCYGSLRHNANIAAARLAVANAKAERDAAIAWVAELEREAETARMQLAACGVLVGCDTEESLARNSTMHPDCMCDSVRRCIDAAKRQIDLRARVAELEKAAPARQWRREYYSDRPFWMNWRTDASGGRYVAVQDRPIASYAGFVSLHDDTWCIPHLDGDTEDTLPPLPNSSAPLTGSPMPNHSETPKSSPVPGSNPAVTLAFKQSLNEASEIVKDWPEWKRSYCQSPPDRDTNRDTVTRSPTTRELVARLAEAVSNYFEDGTVTSVELVTRLRDIAADARRGGAE